MKKNIWWLICTIGCILCACSSEYSVDGYENFQPIYHSNYEINYYLLPSENFSDRFQYIDIDYYYREKYKTMGDFIEKSLVSISYDQEIYEEAKEYCFQNMQLSDSNTVEHGGYTFIENMKLAVEQERLGNSFPHWFNMLAYNDEQIKLVFIGFYSPEYTSDDARNICENWDAFWEKHFSDICDWRN